MPDLNELLEAYQKRYPKKREIEEEAKEVTTVTQKGK